MHFSFILQSALLSLATIVMAGSASVERSHPGPPGTTGKGGWGMCIRSSNRMAVPLPFRTQAERILPIALRALMALRPKALW